MTVNARDNERIASEIIARREKGMWAKGMRSWKHRNRERRKGLCGYVNHSESIYSLQIPLLETGRRVTVQTLVGDKKCSSENTAPPL